MNRDRGVVDGGSPMSRAEDKCDEVEVSRLLAGAAKAVASARYCWLATTAENGVRHPARWQGDGHLSARRRRRLRYIDRGGYAARKRVGGTPALEGRL